MPKTIWVFITAIGILFTLFSGCLDNPESSKSQPVFVAYVVASDEYWDSNTKDYIKGNNISVFSFVQSSPRAAALSATIDGKAPTTAKADWDDDFMLLGMGYECTYLNEPLVGTKTVTLTSDVGSASGTITIPNATVLISPTDGDTVSPFLDLVVNWTGNAQWYLFYSRAVSKDHKYTYIHGDTVIVGNTITISALRIPAAAYRIRVTVDGMNGAPPTPGSTGNMTGSGPGFLYAANDMGDYKTRSAEVYLTGRSASKPASTAAKDDRAPKALFKRMMRLMP